MTNKEKMQLCKDILARAFEHIENIDPSIKVKTETGMRGRMIDPSKFIVFIKLPCGRGKEYLEKAQV